jgi:hypothetical protein
LAIAFFFSPDVQSPEVLSQRVAHQGRTIPPRLPCRLVGCLQEFLIEDNLNCFHIVDSIPHYTPQSNNGGNLRAGSLRYLGGISVRGCWTKKSHMMVLALISWVVRPASHSGNGSPPGQVCPPPSMV